MEEEYSFAAKGVRFRPVMSTFFLPWRMGCGRGSNCYKDSQGFAQFTAQ